jgi:D-beta-D-heptose 7-phosphate kinase/D-beta-D-heptose 1-phosphate adenosyltransferase
MARVIRTAQQEGKVVVFTNGCFDLLHSGHVHLLQSTRQLGDLLLVAINSDDSIQRLKGKKRPILPEIDRVTMLAALACVDYVVVFEKDTPIGLAKGDQYSLEEVVGHEVVQGYGGRVERVSTLQHRSTSDIVARIL